MKEAKLSIRIEKVQVKVVYIKLVHPLLCTTKQQHSIVQMTVFTYYAFFYTRKLHFMHLAYMPVNEAGFHWNQSEGFIQDTEETCEIRLYNKNNTYVQTK